MMTASPRLCTSTGTSHEWFVFVDEPSSTRHERAFCAAPGSCRRRPALAGSVSAVCGNSGRSFQGPQLSQRRKPRDCVVRKALPDWLQTGVVVQRHHRDPDQSSFVSFRRHGRSAHRAEPTANLGEGLEPGRLSAWAGPGESFFREGHPGHHRRARKPLAVRTRTQMREVRVAGGRKPDIAAETTAVQSLDHDTNASQAHRQSVHRRVRRKVLNSA